MSEPTHVGCYDSGIQKVRIIAPDAGADVQWIARRAGFDGVGGKDMLWN
jgi:hypothetical protein